MEFSNINSWLIEKLYASLILLFSGITILCVGNHGGIVVSCRFSKLSTKACIHPVQF